MKKALNLLLLLHPVFARAAAAGKDINIDSGRDLLSFFDLLSHFHAIPCMLEMSEPMPFSFFRVDCLLTLVTSWLHAVGRM